jgi:hypothetical protein
MARQEDSILTDQETGLEREEIGATGGTSAPFDPTEVRIETRTLSIDLLAQRLEKGTIDRAPALARSSVWDEVSQSRLIESLLVRMPLPAFYFDTSREDRWLVLDGLHRLCALDRFINAKTLKLSGLAFFDHLEGKAFKGLPRHLQRRILETQVSAHLIQEGTPAGVRHALFKRINTVAPPLSDQELRHLLHPGPAAKLLDRLAESEAFRTATGGDVGPERLTDRACVLRGLAFHLTPYGEYQTGDLDAFLATAMAALNALEGERLDALEAKFLRAMRAASEIFGPDAFRKRFDPEAPRAPINRALFEVWAVTLAALDEARLALAIERRDRLKEDFIKLLNKNKTFVDAISDGTGDPRKVSKRFSAIEKLIEGVLR